jgi:hypothetical protein
VDKPVVLAVLAPLVRIARRDFGKRDAEQEMARTLARFG